MALDRFKNMIRREIMLYLSELAGNRMGIVESYDPTSYSATVRIQPEDQLTGFLPIGTDWSGNGWGLVSPPTKGDVVEVSFQEHGKNAAYITKRFYSSKTQPPQAPSGEYWLIHKNGQFLKLLNDGTIESNGPWNQTGPVTITGNTSITGNLAVTGNITATGDIIDNTATNSESMAQQRSVYNGHDHNIPGGGVTDPPNQQEP